MIQRLIAVFCHNFSGGVYLSLNGPGTTIPNDGYVLASGIGAEDYGLHCNTDKSGCCRSSDTPPGHWYRPDGTQVGSFTQEAANTGAVVAPCWNGSAESLTP